MSEIRDDNNEKKNEAYNTKRENYQRLFSASMSGKRQSQQEKSIKEGQILQELKVENEKKAKTK